MAAYRTDTGMFDASLSSLHGRLAAQRWPVILAFGVIRDNEIGQRNSGNNAPHLGEKVLLAGSSGAQAQVKAGLLHGW